MNAYRISSKAGVDFGVYEGDTPEAAFAAMVAEGGDGVDSEGGSTSGSIGDWVIDPVVDDVVVEYMPEYLRSSHEAAGNSGRWPHNGATRYACSAALAEDMTEVFGNWCRVVPGADPSKYSRINGYPE